MARRIRNWRQQGNAPVDTPVEMPLEEPVDVPDKALALVPIETASFAASGAVVLVAPSGHRVEGLTLDQVAALLRELA